MTLNQTFAAVSSVAVVGVVAIGLYLGGPPGEQRLLRIDERRVRDLRGLAGAIDGYWVSTGALPQSLDQLLEGQRMRSVPTDPVSGDDYEYAAMEESRYRLCAVFDRPSEGVERSGFWAHEAGRHCFTISPRANVPTLRGRPVPLVNPATGEVWP